MIEVIEVKTRKQLKAFATFPLKLYKGCKYYVPSLRSDEMSIMNPKKNFNLEECDCRCFLAYKDGKLSGRIAGIIHRTANELYGNKFIRFSRFEAIDDIEVFKALLDKVKEFGKSEGMEKIHGPWGFNDTDREGLLTKGFDRRSTYATNYYYPYYAENMVKLGYKDESKWIERIFTVPKTPYERIARVSDKIIERNKLVDVARTMSVKKIVKKYGDEFFKTYNESYGNLDEYVPFTSRSKENVLKQFATVINVRYMCFLVNQEGEVAGFAVILPSIADALIKHKGKLFPFGFIDVLKSIKKPKELEMALIGVKDRYKNAGLNAVLMTHIMYNLMEDGMKDVESNPMLEDNYSIQANWKFTENEIIKNRQTYVQEI